MFSKTIMKQSIKNNYKIWLIITAVTSFFLILMFVAYNLRSSGDVSDGPSITVQQMLVVSFYSMLGFVLPMIYNIFVGNKIVSAEVDSGVLSYTLNTPITRKKVITTKAIYVILSTILMIVVVTLIGLLMNMLYSADLDIKIFLLLNLGMLLFSLAISGIVFFTSSYFNKSNNAMAVGAGIPILFFVLSLVSGLSDSFEFVKYFSLNTLFDTTNIVAGSGYVIPFIAMGVIAIFTFVASIMYFEKKDLPI